MYDVDVDMGSGIVEVTVDPGDGAVLASKAEGVRTQVMQQEPRQTPDEPMTPTTPTTPMTPTTPTPPTGPGRSRAIRLSATNAALALLAIPFLIALTQVVFDGPLTSLDEQVAAGVNSYHRRDSGRVPLIRAITDLGSVPVLVGLVVVTAACLWVRGAAKRRQAIYLLATTAGAAALNRLLKAVVDRSRPEFEEVIATATGKSFPSGHALNSTTVYGSLLIVAWPHLRTLLTRAAAVAATASIVGAIAASRVLLVVHYVTDVVAGVALGALLLVASLALFRTWLLAEEGNSDRPTP